MDRQAESELSDLLRGAGVDSGAQERTLAYWRLLREANERQNLTRLIEPAAFFSGHVLDVLELRKLRERTMGPDAFAQEWMDLGSGAGVPGLLSGAIFEDERWLLVDSEHRKAEFLAQTAEKLGLSGRVRAFHGRAEAIGGRFVGAGVASKAVGPVEKLYNWMRGCSTWNTLILFKGPKWEEEWREFSRSTRGKELRESARAEYQTPEGASRVIIQLTRVPRGTKKD
jgi:16S rRNA (guanine527-N7)-methyltransferase